MLRGRDGLRRAQLRLARAPIGARRDAARQRAAREAFQPGQPGLGGERDADAGLALRGVGFALERCEPAAQIVQDRAITAPQRRDAGLETLQLRARRVAVLGAQRRGRGERAQPAVEAVHALGLGVPEAGLRLRQRLAMRAVEELLQRRGGMRCKREMRGKAFCFRAHGLERGTRRREIAAQQRARRGRGGHPGARDPVPERRVARIAQQQRAHHHPGPCRVGFAPEQTFQHAAPAIERCQIVELEDDRVDQPAAGAHRAGAVGSALVRLERLLEPPPRIARRRAQAALAEREQERRVGLERLGRQQLEPVAEQRAAALREHARRLLRGDRRDARPVAALRQQRDGVLDLPGAAQQRRRAAQVIRLQHLGKLARRPPAQKSEHQRMQLIDAPLVGGRLAHEIVVQRQVDQQAARVRLARERSRDLDRHARQAGDAQQEGARLRLELLEDLSGQIVEDGLRRRVARKLGHAARELGVLEHEDQPRGPALRALHEQRERILAQRLAAQLRDASELLTVETQCVPSQALHLPGDAIAREGRRRIDAAGDDDAALARNLRDRRLEHLLQRAFRRHRLQAVEHQRERRLCAREQLAKEPAREGREPGALRAAEHRILARATAFELARRVSEIVKERRDVRVVRIHLIPQALHAARLDVARSERGLAGARRPGDPDHAAPGRVFQPGEEPLARHRRADHRSGGLGECDVALPGCRHCRTSTTRASSRRAEGRRGLVRTPAVCHRAGAGGLQIAYRLVPPRHAFAPRVGRAAPAAGDAPDRVHAARHARQV